MHLSRAEVPVNSKVSAFAEFISYLGGKIDTRTHYDHVNVLGMTFKENVAYESANDITLKSLFIGNACYYRENWIVKMLLKIHSLS